MFSSCSLAAHKTFVTSALQTSITSRSQYPGIEELPRRTIHGFTGQDVSQFRSSGLISVGMSKSFPSTTAFEVNPLLCLFSLH